MWVISIGYSERDDDADELDEKNEDDDADENR